MDVSLILTHRCNLACGYCYAGEHYRNEIDDEVLERSVDLLFADDADTVQLSFFGGEPFLAFDSMKRAVALAELRTAERGRRLILQCTTNGSVIDDEHIAFIREHGMRMTVSIDGVREAHDLTRPCAGGKSSFDQVHAGLRKLVDAGAKPDAMMVISPETAPFTYRSVSFLWGEGVSTVRANMVLDAPWTREDRDELREELLAVGWEMVARRTRGEQVSFEPFEKGLKKRRARRFATGTAVGAAVGGAAAAKGRSQVVVGTRGHLYPCAPMVGEDRDEGPEAALRIGHLDEGADRIAQRVECEGTKCGRGGGCECAAYLETGDRHTAGPNGRWYARVCDELGIAIATAIANHYAPPPEDDQPSRRPFLIGMAAAVGGLAVGVPALLRAGLFGGEEPGCSLLVDPTGENPPVPGEMLAPPEPPDPIPAGGITAPPEPEPEPIIDGDMAAPPEPEPEVHVRGKLLAPPEPKPEPEPEPEPEERILGDFG